MPHVYVAQKLGTDKSLVGSLIHYVICVNSKANGLAD